MKKKLYRSETNKMIGGVCAGIAEYFDIDPTIVRIIYAVLSFFTTAFPGIILYIILLIIIPKKSEEEYPPYDGNCPPPYQQPPYQQDNFNGDNNNNNQ